VGAGGFEYVGCTKKDLWNYTILILGTQKIKGADVQMFIDNLGMLKQLDPIFSLNMKWMMVNWFKCFGLIQLVGRTMSILVVCYLFILFTTPTNMT
jgi:hypothetical protein